MDAYSARRHAVTRVACIPIHPVIEDAQPLISELIASGDPQLKQNAEQLQMDMLEQQIWALQPDDPQRSVILVELKGILIRNSKRDWPASTLKVLAIRAHDLGLPALSSHLFKRLAQVDPNNEEKWRQVSSNWLLADGHYLDAAKAAFDRQKAAPTLALQRKNFLLGLSILESGNMLNVAMKEAQERITPALKQDAPTLRVLTRMALAANRPDLASEYAQRLLETPHGKAAGTVGQHTAQVRVAAHITDYGVNRSEWTYLDGPHGNLLRAQLDARAGNDQVGIVRVADTQTHAEQNVRNVKPAKNTGSEGTTPLAVEDDYSLAYRVFLANRELDKALDVVNRALLRNPDDVIWIKRRAVTNEWAGNQPVALQAWLMLARRTNNQEAWQAVERLASGLYDDVAYIEALRHRAHGSADELLLTDQITDTYERLGDPNSALEFLQTHIVKSAHQRELLERYAALAERAGNDRLALDTWLKLNRKFGPKRDYALRIASIYNVNGDFSAAMNALVTVREQVSDGDEIYWRTLWIIATRNGRDDVARIAARNLIINSNPSDEDLIAMGDLWNAYPIDAGRLAEESFRRYGSIASLQQAIYQYSEAKAWTRIDALLSHLTPEQVTAAAKSPELLLAKAEFLRQVGRNDESLDALRAAVALNDGAGNARVALTWALVDRGSDAELRMSLLRWRAEAEEDSRLWGPYAAGYMRLAEEGNSLHFFHKQQPTKYQDPLWLLTYAEALENFGRPDEAWSLRQRAWRQISQQRETLLGRVNQIVPPPTSSAAQTIREEVPGQAELRAQAATLSQSYAGGDFSRALLLQILREENLKSDTVAETMFAALDSATPGDAARPSATVASSRVVAIDVALAWALSNEPYELARQWMAQRYGAELERPVYAEVAVALAMDDRKALAKLVDQNPDRLPVSSRIESNMRLDRWFEAQRVAFTAASGSPHSDDLNASARELGLLNANYVEPGFSRFHQSLLNFTESDIHLSLRLSDRLSLNVKALSRLQESTSPSLVNVPHDDRSLVASLGWKDSDTSVLIEAGTRQAVKDFTQAALEVSWDRQRALSWTAALGFNQQVTDTPELRVGGLTDNVSLASQWRIGKREFASARLDANRYYDQNRRPLGSGNQIALEAGYNLRLEYPDFTIRGVFTRGTYKTKDIDAGSIFGGLSRDGVATSAEIMPSDFTQKGVLFSFGTDLFTNYTHAWRPFVEAGYINDSKAGWGSTGRVGLAGSVFGNDHAALYYARERSGKSIGSGVPTTEMGVRYRWYF